MTAQVVPFDLGKGASRLVPTIGDPVAQVKAPMLLNARFRADSIAAIAFPLHVPAAALLIAVTLLRSSESFAGMTVTVPHKIAILPLLDGLTQRAERAGAVNLVARGDRGALLGDMVDGVGFLAGLPGGAASIAGKRVLLVGAGGAGRAVLAALCDHAPERVWVADAVPGRALLTARHIGHPAQAAPLDAVARLASAADLAVNATTAGLDDAGGLPIPLDLARPGLLVADVNVRPGGSALGRAAAKSGLTYIDGTAMLANQVDHYIGFLGLAP